MQHFPNLFDNGTLFSKPSNTLLDSIGLVFFGLLLLLSL